MKLLHLVINVRKNEVNNHFEHDHQKPNLVVLLVGIQKFVYSCLFASISSVKSLSLSHSCQKLVWDILIVLQNGCEGFFRFFFLILDNVG